MVYVLSIDGQPLMPSGVCQQPAQHRRLLCFFLFAHIPCSFLKIYTPARRSRDFLLRIEGSSYSHIWNLQRNTCGTSLEKHLKQQLWLIF